MFYIKKFCNSYMYIVQWLRNCFQKHDPMCTLSEWLSLGTKKEIFIPGKKINQKPEFRQFSARKYPSEHGNSGNFFSRKSSEPKPIELSRNRFNTMHWPLFCEDLVKKIKKNNIILAIKSPLKIIWTNLSNKQVVIRRISSKLNKSS